MTKTEIDKIIRTAFSFRNCPYSGDGFYKENKMNQALLDHYEFLVDRLQHHYGDPAGMDHILKAREQIEQGRTKVKSVQSSFYETKVYLTEEGRDALGKGFLYGFATNKAVTDGPSVPLFSEPNSEKQFIIANGSYVAAVWQGSKEYPDEYVETK